MKRRMILILTAGVLCLVLLSAGGWAAAAEPAEEDVEKMFDEWAEKLGGKEFFDRLPEEVRQALEELGITDFSPELLMNLQLADAGRLAMTALKQAARRPLHLACFFTALILIGALFESLTPSAEGLGTLFTVLRDAAFAGAVCLPVCGCIASVASAVRTSSELMTFFLPVFAAVLTASGRQWTAAASSGFLYTAMTGSTALMSGLLLPFLRADLLIGMAAGGEDELGIRPMSEGIRRGITGFFSFAVSAVIGLWSVQKAMAQAADSAALRTGRLALSGLVPVVGSTLSEALCGISGCLTLLRSTVGSLAVFALMILFLPPLAESVCWLAVFAAGRMLAGLMGSRTAVSLFSGVEQTQKMLVAVTAVSAAFLLLSAGMLLSV